jgi:adenine-specific DNA-methyltransferase
MDKLKMHSLNKVDENIEKIGRLFPNCLTERKGENGEIEYAIDFDVLRQELSPVIVEGNEERYQFTWPDKKKSVLLANAPIAKTLRPCREESVDFDNTENLYIEGDNLDVLKLLQETYLGKVKMIYIDPPYNTGNDFVYEDDFAQSVDEYMEYSGQYDENGNRLVKNLDSNGRFHTDWLNMIYPRLKLAKDLLRDDGIIFISIDDNEVTQLRKICDEVFGADNFIAQFIWEKRVTRENRKIISVRHDYVACYTKNYELRDVAIGLMPMTDEAIGRYNNPDNDPRGVWTSVPAIAQAGHGTANQFYTLTTPSGRMVDPPSGSCWRYTRKKMEEAISDKRIWFGSDGNGVPRIKKFITEGKQGLTPETLWLSSSVGTNDSAKRELVNLFDGVAVFETPKPVQLLKQCIQISANDKEAICMDFFGGTSPFAHAVMQLNAEDGGNRKFIMVQIPEETDEKSEAYKAGYKTICEIGKERIRRAGTKIQAENDKLKSVPFIETEEDATLVAAAAHAKGKQGIEQIKPLLEQADISNNLDTGFRVLKLDSTNMKDVYYNPADYEADLFDTLTDNIKDDRTPEDLLFQVMLDLGVLLSSKIEESTIAGKKVFDVTDGFLIACFDDNITEETIKAIAQKKPYYFVMRDSSMANDSVATNFEQIFATYSPDTVRKVL